MDLRLAILLAAWSLAGAAAAQRIDEEILQVPVRVTDAFGK